MSIIRTARAAEGRFTQVSNQLLQDARISDRARGLGARILSYPPNTRIDSVALSNGTKEGRDAVRGALRELEEHGYLTRTKRQDETGKWVTESLFTDGPVALVPATGAPTPENPSPVRPATIHKPAGHTEDGFSGANQTRKEETRKDFPPTPRELADETGSAGEVRDSKDQQQQEDGSWPDYPADLGPDPSDWEDLAEIGRLTLPAAAEYLLIHAGLPVNDISTARVLKWFTPDDEDFLVPILADSQSMKPLPDMNLNVLRGRVKFLREKYGLTETVTRTQRRRTS
ncbi:hypothetical protein [Streptomyces chartreusis]